MLMTIFKIFLISVLLTAINLSFAQSSIAPKGEGLSSSEIANLREILKETPPLNSPQQQVDSFYKKQDAAAVRLGICKRGRESLSNGVPYLLTLMRAGHMQVF